MKSIHEMARYQVTHHNRAGLDSIIEFPRFVSFIETFRRRECIVGRLPFNTVNPFAVVALGQAATNKTVTLGQKQVCSLGGTPGNHLAHVPLIFSKTSSIIISMFPQAHQKVIKISLFGLSQTHTHTLPLPFALL
jgi:hypothetical protein